MVRLLRSYKVKTRYCNKSHNLSLNINYLIENDPILDVPRLVGVLERVERFHKVAVGRRATRNHQGAAITCEIVQKIKNKTRRTHDLSTGYLPASLARAGLVSSLDRVRVGPCVWRRPALR